MVGIQTIEPRSVSIESVAASIVVGAVSIVREAASSDCKRASMQSTLTSIEAGPGTIAGQPVAIFRPLPRLCSGKEGIEPRLATVRFKLSAVG